MIFNESNLIQLYNSAVKAFPKTTKRQHVTGSIQIEKHRMDAISTVLAL
jgi:hypothetical protein